MTELDVESPLSSDLLERIQHFVASDINKNFVQLVSVQVKPEEIYVLTFQRILNNWKAFVSSYALEGIYYEITHDATNNATFATVYTRRRTMPAFI